MKKQKIITKPIKETCKKDRTSKKKNTFANIKKIKIFQIQIENEKRNIWKIITKEEKIC